MVGDGAAAPAHAHEDAIRARRALLALESPSTLDFDDPALSTRTARAHESIAHVFTGKEEIFHDHLVDMEGPVKIQFR